MLDIVANYHHIQFQRKRMTQTQENGGKPRFGPDLGTLGSNLGCQFFLQKLALSVIRYHGQLTSCKISEKK